MNKKIFILGLSIISLSNLGFTNEDKKYGVFFCTQDLSQELSDTIETAKLAGTISVPIASSLITTSLLSSGISFPLKVLSVSSSLGSGAVGAYYAYNSSSKFIQRLKNGATQFVAPVSSSAANNKYIKVGNDSIEGNRYRHCSVLTASYKFHNQDQVDLKDYHTNGFYQDDGNNDNSSLGSGNREAVVRDDPIVPSTVCTLVKQLENKKEYRIHKQLINDFFENEAEKGYSLRGRNCCTVAYHAVEKIRGATNVIDNSNFNHGIGMPNSYFAFFVDAVEENKSTVSDKDDTEKPDL